MLRRDRQLRTQIYQLKDAAIFALSLWLAHVIRRHIPIDLLEGRSPQPFAEFAPLFLAIVPGAPLILDLQGFYRRSAVCSRGTTAWILLKGCAWVTVGVILIMFLFRMPALARSVIVLFGLMSYALVFLSEELLQRGFRTHYAELQLKKQVILVGSKEDTDRMKSELSGQSADSISVVAELDLNDQTIQTLVRLLHERTPNGVILNARHTYFGQIEKAIQACEIEGVEAWLVADFFQTQISQASFDEFCGRPVMVFRSAPEASWEGVAKQAVDLLGSLLLLLLSGIPMLLVALLIKVTSPGPVLFRQQRAGLNGRPFKMLKFRSMVSNAEQRKHELAALNEMAGPVFKVTNDPRVTRIGRFLRKFSIDEFPQLINVVRGEMSLVGPRPLPLDEVARFDDPSHRRRLSVKPGLTCLWQVSGRNEVRDFKEWVRLDLHYIDNWSFWLDLKILWRTIPAVLGGTGAK